MFSVREPVPKETRAALHTYDDLLAQLLASRGITDAETAELFLHPSFETHTHDPLLLTDMPRAAERVARAITTHEHIAVWSDYDCDGIPGGVVLHDFLKTCGAQFTNYIPHRHLEGYGVNAGGVAKLAQAGVTLLITVDVGTTDHEALAAARALGIDVIVTDHHLPGETLPDVYALINPNARADEPYPFHELCGAAVAWKLVCATLAVEPALREHMPEGTEKWLLDMVALATIADMVPLVGENRVLATYGLIVLRKSRRIGLQKLCRSTRALQRTLTEEDIAFLFAPRINAASRMGDAQSALALFTTDDEAEADLLAKELEKQNRARKAQAGAVTRAVRARLSERETLPSVIALGDPEWRPSLLGLVAGTIAQEYERPVFLWGREGSNLVKGSVRSGAVHALELMRAAPDTFLEFGGHAASGGFTIREEAVFDLEARLAHAHAQLPAEDDPASAAPKADAVLTLAEATPTLLQRVAALAPFGIGNPKPVFLFRNVSVDTISRFGKGEEHRKLTFAQEGSTCSGILFFARGKIAQTIDALVTGDTVSLLAHLERDQFTRGQPVRLRVVGIERA